MLARAQGLAPRAADLALVNCAIEEYIPEAPYDVVLCIGVLAHVASIPDVVGRVAEALKCGGRAVIQITDDASALGWLLNRYGQVRLRSRTLNRMSRHDVAALAATERLSLTDSRRVWFVAAGVRETARLLRVRHGASHRPIISARTSRRRAAHDIRQGIAMRPAVRRFASPSDD